MQLVQLMQLMPLVQLMQLDSSLALTCNSTSALQEHTVLHQVTTRMHDRSVPSSGDRTSQATTIQMLHPAPWRQIPMRLAANVTPDDNAVPASRPTAT